MISSKKHIQQLVVLLAAKEILNIVVSPGSRNGALVQTLVADGRFNCLNIVDERSAAYFALGMAQANKQPVALLCSSGTAALNYAPAVAEAYYQGVPLVILTADRPDYWIDQLEAQCINQQGIYRNFVAQEIQLPLGESPQEISHANRKINACLNAAFEKQQPVHINIPLEEPLYEFVDEILPTNIRNIPLTHQEVSLTIEKVELLVNRLNQSKQILIVVGQMLPEEGLSELLELFADMTGAVVIAEPLANVQVNNMIGNFDSILSLLSEEDKENLRPQIIITMGRQLVSKRIKQFLRTFQPHEHWHISSLAQHADTYWSLSDVIPLSSKKFLETMLSAFYDVEMGFHLQSSYIMQWTDFSRQAKLHDAQKTSSTFCDQRVHELLKEYIPEGSIMHYGNSASIRYGIMQPNRAKLVFCNRGTSGIDGSLSTAVGFASTSAELNTIVLGDLSFFYDSNALWNNDFPSNLRIIIVNNSGGRIFSMIPGPSKSVAYEKHFLTKHSFRAKGIAESFRIKYISAENEEEVRQGLTYIFSRDCRKACILEVMIEDPLN
ncbi:MAG: 2-succinyl-5-enolpyruvyl-6-hydroxy-3-cyclohexene-1-carboxylic-acid synthase [Mangrovibacterium sp.]